ncbi:MAG: dihydrolipoyl dehydrogenase [Methanomethylovorans sp.]|uniref:dihydrolipoyl dehydrogenase n=1 Tax=Methanomethylovorans sp. TaxID=2758717 RepID=UPI0035313CDA
MKEYDLIVVGTGSGMNYIGPMMDANPEMKVAVIDKDEPGGICLTRGCIPSKILLYPAELVTVIQKARHFGIDAQIKNIDFSKIMDRMRSKISSDMRSIEENLIANPRIDYYKTTAEFVEPYSLKAGEEILKAKMIFLCTGSRPSVPFLKGLKDAGYLTSDTVLQMSVLPKSLAIIGGGYIAAEYGHFFSAMGSKVTIIGRNPYFLPQAEPEISVLAKRMMSERMEILTNHEVLEVRQIAEGKQLLLKHRETGEEKSIVTSDILVATGRESNSDLLKPENGGIDVDKMGWIKVDEHLESSQKNVWVIGDATGKHLFKHVANHESTIVYYNAVLGRKATVDFHAVPSAVFSEPEISSVGMSEKEAAAQYGEDNISIGFYRFQDTGKGIAMDLEDEFVKVILEKETGKILGAHIIGPHASILIHEIIPIMYTPDQSSAPIMYSMDIHPSLSEVIKRALYSRMPINEYHMILKALNLE